jgi:ketosteroid isomerase-like protein
MQKSAFRVFTVVLGMAGGVAVSGLCSAEPAAASPARIGVEKVLRSVEAAMSRGESAEKVTRMLYSDDAVIAEGDTGSMRGMAAAIEGVHGFFDALGPGGGKGCKFTLVDPAVQSTETFASFISLICKPNPPTLKEEMDLRLMYVWKKLPQGWRVVLESVQAGNF